MPTTKKRPSRRRSPKKVTTRGKVLRWIGSILALVVISGTLYVLFSGVGTDQVLPLSAIGNTVATVQSAVTSVTLKVKDFFQNWHNYDTLKAENEDLVRQNTQLTLQLNEAKEDTAEKARLLSLLGATETYDTLDPVYAKVIARDAGQWFSTFSINKGTSSGLTVGMSVVNENGLIGYIYEIGTNYAKVITVIDSRSGLACLIQRTRDSGVMRGGVSGISDSAQCYIYYLPNINNIIPGDTVITSGTDSLYPKGLVIGTVSEVSLSVGSEGGYAVVSPAVDFLHIEEVMVLTNSVQSSADDTLPTLMTPTPAPTSAPTPTPDPGAVPSVDPDTGETIWHYPTGKDESADQVIDMLPEDDWVDAN